MKKKNLVQKLVAAPYLIWMFVFVVVPIFMVIYFAFAGENGFTITNIKEVFDYGEIFVRSLRVSAVATVICFIIGYPVAYFLSRMNTKSQGLIIMIIMIPMWMNFLLRTYAWMTLLGNEGVINSLLSVVGIGPFKMLNTQGAVVLGMVYNYLPYMILPIYAVMVKIDKNLIEAAADLGSNKLKTMLKVVLPLSLPGILSGIAMVFVPAISTFIISRMLGGGSNLLIGDLIEMQFLGNAYNPGLGSAISFILLIIVLIIMAVVNRLDKSDEERVLL